MTARCRARRRAIRRSYPLKSASRRGMVVTPPPGICDSRPGTCFTENRSNGGTKSKRRNRISATGLPGPPNAGVGAPCRHHGHPRRQRPAGHDAMAGTVGNSRTRSISEVRAPTSAGGRRRHLARHPATTAATAAGSRRTDRALAGGGEVGGWIGESVGAAGHRPFFEVTGAFSDHRAVRARRGSEGDRA